MKTLEEIRQCKRLIIGQIGLDGGMGVIAIGGWQGSVIWSTGGGWDHVSVRPSKSRIMPSWEDMCCLKEILFRDDEAVIQIHPVKTEYVNNVSNCLHLWRYQGEFPLPPAWMVGVKDGQSMTDMYKEAVEMLQKGESDLWQ